jgi:FimV-like protein
LPLPAPKAKPNWFDAIVASPKLLWSGLALAALLLLWLWVRVRRRRQDAAFDRELQTQTLGDNFELESAEYEPQPHTAPDAPRSVDTADRGQRTAGATDESTRPPASAWHQGLNLDLKEKRPLAPGADLAKPGVPDAPLESDAVAAGRNAQPIGFDLSSVSLDLEPPAAATDASNQHWLTKIALAAEFKAMGDVQGARVLLEEVVAEAPEGIRAQAQAALAQL